MRVFLLALPLFLATPRIYGEWGAEASLGATPMAYYSEEIKKESSSYRTQISGGRHAASFTGKIWYEWIGMRVWLDYYFPGSGAQKTQYNQQSGQGSSGQSSEATGVPYAGAQTYRAELQLRKFYYGHREFFAFNTGLIYRQVTTDLSGQPADYIPQSILSRYLTLGVSVEPLLTYFGRYELSLPLEFSVGLKFPEGGIFQGGGPGSVMLAAGLRLQQEPRGIFFTTQAMLAFFETGYTAGGATYGFQQFEVTMRVAAGYYFKDPVFNE